MARQKRPRSDAAGVAALVAIHHADAETVFRDVQGQGRA
jgi:hypothetical protein